MLHQLQIHLEFDAIYNLEKEHKKENILNNGNIIKIESNQSKFSLKRKDTFHSLNIDILNGKCKKLFKEIFYILNRDRDRDRDCDRERERDRSKSCSRSRDRDRDRDRDRYRERERERDRDRDRDKERSRS